MRTLFSLVNVMAVGLWLSEHREADASTGRHPSDAVRRRAAAHQVHQHERPDGRPHEGVQRPAGHEHVERAGEGDLQREVSNFQVCPKNNGTDAEMIPALTDLLFCLFLCFCFRFELFQVHPTPQELWPDCFLFGEKGFDFGCFPLLPFFLLLFNIWPPIEFFVVSDGGRVCALLLLDQKEWKLQEHRAQELQTPWKKPGILSVAE